MCSCSFVYARGCPTLYPRLHICIPDSDQTLLPSYGNGSSDDKLCFVWWFRSHVVTIYQYDEHGTYSADGVAPLDTTLAAVVCDLVKRTCSMTTAQHADQRVKDATLSRHLRYLLELNRTLPANMSAVATLWEHFYKRLVWVFNVAIR